FEQLVLTADSYTVTDSTYLYLPMLFANDIPPAFPDPFPTNLAEAQFGIFDLSQGAFSVAVSATNQTPLLGPEYLVGPIYFRVDDDGNGIPSVYAGYQQATFLSPLSPGTYTVSYEIFQAGNSIFTDAYTIQSNPTPVPTPALLPGLIAFGLSALRKRQAEEVSDSEVQV
ncbi:MAG: PTPA-CTERM sorting domain-containing protein, partial [Nodosilinea sp.]